MLYGEAWPLSCSRCGGALASEGDYCPCGGRSALYLPQATRSGRMHPDTPRRLTGPEAMAQLEARRDPPGA